MKKVIWITLAVSLLLSGCGKTETIVADTSNNSIEAGVPKNTIPT